MVNGLYDVPQTDAIGEASMAALVARLRASCPKPEAIPTGSSVDDTLALLCFEWIALVRSALGDRIDPDATITRWDAALDGAARRHVRDWYNARGRNRQAGADSSIDAIGDAARVYLDRLSASGMGDGKVEQPRFEVSSGGRDHDGGIFGRGDTSDAWIRSPGSGCCT